MSGRILRQVRLSQNLCSATITASRRAHSALAIDTLTPDPDHHDTDTVAGPSHGASLTGTAPLTNVLSVQTSEDIGQNLPEFPSEQLKGTSREDTKKVKRTLSSSEAGSSSSRPESSRVEAYLASIHAAGLEPTFADLERCRPPKYAKPDSPQYPIDYNALIDTLCRSFSKEQLRRFLEQWDINCPWCRHHRKKIQYAEYIVEKMWSWPSLKEVERARRDRTEVSVRSFPVTASELFLLLGKDGADLLDMSMRYNVHISLTTDPLALRVEGLRGSLKRLTDHINSLKQFLVEDTFQLPTKMSIRPDMVQRISRLAGAYLENIGSEGMIRICAKNSGNLEIAKRLASRANHELNRDTLAARLAYMPSSKAEFPIPVTLFPSTYALYPFLSPRPLPWIMNTGGAFRVRRVGEWLAHDNGEDIEATGGLVGGKGRILSASQEPVDLRQILFRDIPNDPKSSSSSYRMIKASMGHLLLTTTSPGQRATLIPPLKGSHSFSNVLKELTSSDIQTSFVPSLSAPLVGSSPAQQKIIHRLIYQAIPPTNTLKRSSDTPVHAAPRINEVLCFEVVLSHPKPTRSDSAGDRDGNAPETSSDPSEKNAEGNMDDDVPSFHAPSSFQCWIGVQAQMDLMMPDRPMDMQLTAVDSHAITPGVEPPELRSYMDNLRAYLEGEGENVPQPDPPLLLHYEGSRFILHTSASVRQSVEYVTVPDKHSHPETAEDLPPVKVVSESILDLESNQKSTHCEITCEDHLSEDSWRRFLGDCDQLTSTTYRPMGTVPLQEPRPAKEL